LVRKCSCQICKSKGDTDTFYKVTDDKGKSKYYCNKEEYDQFINEKSKREELITYIAIEVFNYEEGQIISPIMLKKIKELHSFYPYEVIQQCFIEQKETIQYWIGAKQFTNEYNMVCYVMKIIEGKINDIYAKWKFTRQQELKQENNTLDLNTLNHVQTIKQQNEQNTGILAFLDEGDL
jgi:hypothetical protein